MRYLLVCPDDFLFRLLRGAPLPGQSPVYVVEDPALRARIARRGATAIAGSLEDPALYRRAFRTGRETALVAVPHDRRDRILEALRAAAPQAPLVAPKDDARALDPVIDHHPEEAPVRARFKDVRPSYGATSTILTEYLRAAEVKVTQKLATALLYGIKSDTLHLDRGGTRADMEAFAFLYLLANHDALRRIERPELPNEALDVLAQGIARRQLAQGVLFSHLGPIGGAGLIPQFADFFLQVDGVEWAVVSGVVGSEIHVSVRNVGHVRAAGEVVCNAFGDVGRAGGHRAMAKAVIPLKGWRAGVDEASGDAIRHGIVERFLRALKS